MSEIEFEKLKDKVEMLIKLVVEEKEIYSLALESGWSMKKVEEIHQVMDKFAKLNPQDYEYGDIEKSFNEIGLHYQDAKLVCGIFNKTRQYKTVVERFFATLT